MSHPIQTYSLSRGIELSFTDSGAPPNSVDYTTLLVVHGTAFNAYQFHKLHSYAHALNLRTILLHRRDYVGSTPYSLTELEEISEAKKVFWERLSAQLAEFVVMLIQKEGIPRLTQSTESRSEGLDLKGRGGVAIMGWSFGCATVLSLFGVVKNPMISDKHYDLLQEYIGDFILYDPPHVAFGYPVPSDSPNYVPWEDLTIPPGNIPQVFSDWVSSYYDHPCYDPQSRCLSYTASIYDLDGRPKAETTSVSSWTEEEIAKGIEGNNAKTEVSMFMSGMQKTIGVFAHQALFDEKSVQHWFPNAKVTYLGVTRTNWTCAWAEMETKRRYYNAKDFLRQGRDLKFIDIDGANHFPHWEQAQEFLKVLRKGIHSNNTALRG
ncbi:hypothetical protein BDP27DRAFT_1272015 [Rhodocollybia butyracea]|uniref:AB hydrolase-1 domain-containing protein n=1 Tax=Rhodocollybia butyracea TaxID=206335 RepID=A0A9P5PAD3_9AGAR|nr:hypothetical protein BDP27DRAFT_1272015 [Rhodocollybia butyracea]